MAWLTGYDGWSFYVHQGVLVFHDRDPVWWGRGQDANGAVRTVWMADESVRGYADNFVQSTERHPMQNLAAIIAEAGHEAGRIGCELENYYFSAKAYLTLTESLPKATIVDATALVNWQRGVKSGEEIALMRKAARIAEKVIDGVIDRVEPGAAQERACGGDLWRHRARRGRGLGRLPGHRAAAALGVRCGGAAPDLGRPGVRDRGRRRSSSWRAATGAITRRSAARCSWANRRSSCAGRKERWSRGWRRGWRPHARATGRVISPMRWRPRWSGPGSSAGRAAAIPSG